MGARGELIYPGVRKLESSAANNRSMECVASNGPHLRGSKIKKDTRGFVISLRIILIWFFLQLS